MEPPILQVSFRDVPPPRQPELEEKVRQRAEKLERFCDHIMSCRVAIERPHRSEASGNPYRVRIDLTVPPGHEVVVRKGAGDSDPAADVMTVVNGAFEAAERQLKALSEKQRGDVKTHETPLALVTRLFRDAGYGFLKTVDGRDVYFHKNSVVDGWDRLELGTQVRFAESMGEEGPQATTVQVVDKPGAAVAQADEKMIAEPLGWEAEQR
ncbi:MAG TPA: HPF/RaiA family ribosome-associated protein [Thermoanaerobaculia bacterium]|nr:HPF/RaiA family ribosome-associated protein [Thermoanaerobaculia bacterium]